MALRKEQPIHRPQNYFRSVHSRHLRCQEDPLGGTGSGGLTPVLTGDRPLFTDPVLVEYIVVLCPMYQHFPGQEQVEFFQNVPNNVTSTSQLSTSWEYCGNI